jgi:hypothetical protein
VSILNLTKVLIVDVDGTLCPVDTLRILRLRWRLRHPLSPFEPNVWRKESKQLEKLKLWNNVGFGGSAIAHRPVVHLMKLWHSEGGRVFIVSGSATQLARWSVSGISEIPLEVFGSTESINLTKQNKAKFIQENFHLEDVSYIGDSIDDVFTWRIVKKAYVICNRKTKTIDFSIVNNNVIFLPQMSYFGRVLASMKLLLQKKVA